MGVLEGWVFAEEKSKPHLQSQLDGRVPVLLWGDQLIDLLREVVETVFDHGLLLNNCVLTLHDSKQKLVLQVQVLLACWVTDFLHQPLHKLRQFTSIPLTAILEYNLGEHSDDVSDFFASVLTVTLEKKQSYHV